ncbi:PEP/pyruvate-binding domain-containing protein [Rhodococcus qingshengii]|uniref:PEP/pyruvate-binding domain-containing protein n=1 Tax=Rhodococcus qingshengii TaxID=334542 RepID=UPI001BED2395|nr:PEP/pyruvate-binding domain-containing protein [Rhodococcus qingshengii]MBT2273809.1 phosphoenolpyruvate synthase [Rhodococcus qingshengii]
MSDSPRNADDDVVYLAAGKSWSIGQIGGKGEGLLRLLDAGVQVPAAWVIPAAVSLDESARARMQNEQLHQWWMEHGAAGRWAVRSSAVAEDLINASFAGVYDTVLGVDSEAALTAAVQRCWDSVASVRAARYRDHTDTTMTVGIAVIVQQLVSARVAGVMMTVDPEAPFVDHIVVEASWGLGESVVSGAVDPDHLVIDRDSGAVVTDTIGTKATQSVYRNGAVVTEPVAAEQQSVRCLSDDNISALHALAVQVETVIGPGRDLEWVIDDQNRLFVVQDRPITGLPPRHPTRIASRVFGDEYLAGCGRPLQLDLVTPWIEDTLFGDLARFMGRTDLTAATPLIIHKGYGYMDGEWVARLLTALPRSQRNLQVCEWFPQVWYDDMMGRRWRPWLLPKMLVAPWRDRGRGTLSKNATALTRHAERVMSAVAPKIGSDWSAVTDAVWLAELDEVLEFGHEHFRVLRWGMGLYNPALHSIFARLLQVWCADDSGELYNTLISDIGQTWTATINTELQQLSAVARADRPLYDALTAGRGYEILREQFSDAGFWTQFDTFLQAYGHRGVSRDPADARWRDDPGTVISLVRAQLTINDTVAATSSAATHQEPLDGEAILTARTAKSPIRRRVLLGVLTRVREYTRYRENQRYYLDVIITQLRNLLLEQAGRLVARHVIDTPADLYLLHESELRAAIAGTGLLPSATELTERRERFARDAHRLPDKYVFDGVETDGPAAAAIAGIEPGDWTGVGVSRGCASGPSRVVHDVGGLSDVRSGDVLVVKTIDPAWTSVFPLLAGLVTETGGALSHGAILAREYRIPAVSGVTRATETISTGSHVCLDGAVGYVRPVNPEQEAAR